jgi:spore coat polysaccharide biosynthesis protein SpsF
MIVAIIQARLGSTRLPGKILMEVDGKPLLKYMIDRVQRSKLVDKIVIATTVDKRDNPIVDFCNENGIDVYRGSENDVLDRYYQAAKKYNPKHVVRLTSDCPLIDPVIIDRTIQLFLDSKVDYAANTAPPETSKYPDGSDVEVFSFKNLEKIWMEATDQKDREHVTFYFWRRGKEFSTIQLDNEYNWGKYRFTIDYPEDFEVISFVIQELKRKNIFGTVKEIIEILNENPEILNKNSMYTWGANW